MKHIFIIVFLIFLCCSCALRKVHRIIDQKDKYVWISIGETKTYVLSIDSSEGIWFSGKITIDNIDTLYLRGFQKGSNHITYVKPHSSDTSKNPKFGNIYMWSRGYRADTVDVKNNRDSLKKLPVYFTLYKTKK